MAFGYNLQHPSATNLRCRVDVWAMSEAADDSYGDPQYVPILTGIYVDIQDLKGFEIIRAAKVASKSTHYLTCRYNSVTSVIQPAMRVMWQGRTFLVWAVLDEFVPRKVWMALYCEELMDQ